MTAYIVVFLLSAHFIADFVCQTRRMAENKSRSLHWLSVHIFVYTIVIGILLTQPLVGIVGVYGFIGFIFINGVLHFAVDFCTSKASGYFYMKAQNTKALRYQTESEAIKRDKKVAVHMKWFWTVIGFDQWLHAMCLIITYQKLFVE